MLFEFGVSRSLNVGFNLIELVRSCVSQHNVSSGMCDYYTVKVGNVVRNVDDGVEYVLNYHLNGTIKYWMIGKLIFRSDGLVEVHAYPLFSDYKPVLVFNPFEDDPSKLVEVIGELIKILRG